MSNVVPFPFGMIMGREIEEYIIETTMKAGLTREMAMNVVLEYQDIHEVLFSREDSEIIIPAGLPIGEVALEYIKESITTVYLNKMGYVANIIIGILAREQLNSVK